MGDRRLRESVILGSFKSGSFCWVGAFLYQGLGFFLQRTKDVVVLCMSIIESNRVCYGHSSHGIPVSS